MTQKSFPSVLFASWHFYLDQSNGASISTRILLLELARRGWQVKTLCGFAQDFRRPQSLDELLARHGCLLRKTVDRDGFTATSFADHGIESLVLIPKTSHIRPSQDDCLVYLQLLRDTLNRQRLSLLLTYGGFALGGLILSEARQFSVRTAVFLHNLAYDDARYFHGVDRVFVPSNYAMEHYQRRLGLETTPIPPLIASAKRFSRNTNVVASEKYVLFINPELGKGVGIFIALARELAVRRPDIRFLVVEGRQGADLLRRFGREYLAKVDNIDYARNTDRVEELYRLARFIIVPSLYHETFGRVAAEAMTLGVPVIASTRGALPEVVGDAGILLDIPEKYVPEKLILASPEDVEPWVDATVRLWDDAELRSKLRSQGQKRAEKWRYETIAGEYDIQLREMLK